MPDRRNKMKLNRLLYCLYPPYEAYQTDKIIADRNRRMAEDARWELMKIEIRDSLPKENYINFETRARHIQDAELHRKEILDNKASTFIVAIGIAISIVSAIPVLFATERNIPIMWVNIAGFFYFLAVVHFFISAYYAVKVRKVAGFAQHCVGTFLDSMKTSKGSIEEHIVLTLAQTRWNEDLLTQKTNNISVVEDLFLRGLAFVAFAAIISITMNILHNCK
jgi:hypothetical protein